MRGLGPGPSTGVGDFVRAAADCTSPAGSAIRTAAIARTTVRRWRIRRKVSAPLLVVNTILHPDRPLTAMDDGRERIPSDGDLSGLARDFLARIGQIGEDLGQ